MTVVDEQTSKELLVVGGPNGAGKTTWVGGARQVHEGILYLSADQIAAELSPAKPEEAAIRAGREFLHRLRIAVDDGEEMIVESTLFWPRSGPHLYFNGGDFFEMVASGDVETTVVHNEARLSLFKDIGS